MFSEPTVFVVDEDTSARSAVCGVARTLNLACKTFASGLEFLDAYDPATPGCLVTETRMMGISGLQLQRRLLSEGATLPIIFLTAHADVATIVKAMRQGAVHFLEKPFREQELWDAIQEAIHVGEECRQMQVWQQKMEHCLTSLTAKEREVLRLIGQDKANRVIASEMGVCIRTIEIHRVKLMNKLEAKSFPELMQIAGVATDEYL